MSDENPKMLPKTLAGAVCVEWKKCGKRNCRCARGNLHGPYYYRYWREDGRLRKEYIRRREAPEAMHRCQARRLQRVAIAHGWADYRDMLEAIRKYVQK